MSRYNGKPTCTQCSLDAQFQVDGVLICEYHVGNVLMTLLSLREDAMVRKAEDEDRKRY